MISLTKGCASVSDYSWWWRHPKRSKWFFASFPPVCYTYHGKHRFLEDTSILKFAVPFPCVTEHPPYIRWASPEREPDLAACKKKHAAHQAVLLWGQVSMGGPVPRGKSTAGSCLVQRGRLWTLLPGLRSLSSCRIAMTVGGHLHPLLWGGDDSGSNRLTLKISWTCIHGNSQQAPFQCWRLLLA